MATPAIQTLMTDAQQVLNLKSMSEIRATLTAVLANANVGTPLNPNLTTQQLWDQFYEIVRQTPTDIESILVNQMMKFVFSPPAPGGAGANHEVIYNNNGVLAGDTKFLWDDGLNKLDIDGSATISGDLTVDTSTLKVDSTNNRVGIGTASPAYKLEVVAPAGNNIVSTFRSGDATAANNAGGGFQSISSATAASRVARVWLDADGADLSSGDYFFIQKNGNSGTVEFVQSSNAAMTFLTNGTERARFNSTGNLAFANGLGIDFSDTASGSGTMTSELLNDYEEGTFTPTISAGAGTPTTTTVNTAQYTKIGKIVVVQIDISIVNIGTASGVLQFTLPFTQGTDANVGATRDVGATANMGQIFYTSPTTAGLAIYNNATVWVNGYRIRGTYTYTV